MLPTVDGAIVALTLLFLTKALAALLAPVLTLKVVASKTNGFVSEAPIRPPWVTRFSVPAETTTTDLPFSVIVPLPVAFRSTVPGVLILLPIAILPAVPPAVRVMALPLIVEVGAVEIY